MILGSVLGVTAIEFVRFLILGLGAGAAYALAGVGLVQVYRGSGVINFAFGAQAFLAAAVYSSLINDLNAPWPVAFLVGVMVAALAGALIEVLVMRPLSDAAPIVRMIATIGVLIAVEQLVPLVLGNIVQRGLQATNYYPQGGFDVYPGEVEVLFFWDRLLLLLVVIGVSVALSLVMTRSRFGLATSAVAEDPLVAQALRVDPRRVSLINWTIGGFLAGLLGVLMMPFWSLTPQPYIIVIVPGLAAALIGRFNSFTPTIVGGVIMGGFASLVSLQQIEWADQVGGWIGWEPSFAGAGWSDALPFLVILVLLSVRGSLFPARGETRGQLPAVGRARLRPQVAAALAVGGFVVSLFLGLSPSDALTKTVAFAIVGLSLVIIIGLAGQISFAQMAMAGLAAIAAARFSTQLDVPFLGALVVAIVFGALAGLIFGLPALRTRGPTLAVVTIGLGYVVERVVFPNWRFSFIGGDDQVGTGIPRRSPEIFGWSIDPISNPERYAAVAVVILVLVLYGVSNLRAGPAGRRMLAVRSNERAAAALGISTQQTKLAAFVLSAAIAGVGGTVLGFKFDEVIPENYGFNDSLGAVIFALIGGIGYLVGPLIGALLTPGGLFEVIFNDFERVEEILLVIGGFIVIVQLIVAPDGIVHDVKRRQTELGDLRPAVDVDEPTWRRIGRLEALGGLGILVGLIDGQSFIGRIEAVISGTTDEGVPADRFPGWLRDTGSFLFDAAGWVAAAGIAVLLILAIRRHRDRGHPWIATVPAGVFLFLLTLHLRVPRLLDPLFPSGVEGEETTNWAAWLAVVILLAAVGLIWLDSRRDHAVQGRVPLWLISGTVGVGVYLLVSSFPSRVSEIVFGLVLGVLFLVLGIGKIRPPETEVRLAYEISAEEVRRPNGGALEVRSLTVRYGPVVAVSDLDLTVAPGTIVGLIGPNGAGKTTAIDAISGFTDLASGTVSLDGIELSSVPVHRRARLGLGRTFQTVEPFDDLTVAENLASATERLRPVDWLLAFVRIPKLVLSSATGRVIESFGLEDELTAFPNELPQGRRRLLGVARALANEPAVLLLDEPAAGLDASETARLGEQLRVVASEQNVGMLLVEHDMSIVTSICDHVVCLDFGTTIFSGPPDQVMNDANIRTAYLGEAADDGNESSGLTSTQTPTAAGSAT